MEPIGIIAGSGELPKLILEACQFRPVFVIAYHKWTDPSLTEGVPHIWLYLGEVGKTLQALKAAGIKQLVIAGGKGERPSLRNIKPDKVGVKLISRIGLRWSGDNNILMTIQRFLEEEGFILKSPQDIVTSLLAPAECLSAIAPCEAALKDIEQGTQALNHLSVLDCGQGLAIQNGLILGIECAEGTDNCIQRCGQLRRAGEPLPIYVKRSKINQSELLDLPVIGPKTIEILIQAQFQGLAFEAAKTLIILKDQVQNMADAAGIFLWSH